MDRTDSTSSTENTGTSHEAEIARLSAEIEQLRARVSAPAPPRSSGWFRSFLAVLLILLGILLAPIAVVAVWTKSEVTDTNRFVATLAPLAKDPAFQAFLVDEIVVAVDTQIDIDALATDLFTGLESLDLPPQALAALKLLKEPAVQGVRSLIQTATARVVSSDAFAQVWEQALRISHTQILAALQGETSGALVVSDTGEVGVQLGPIIDAVKTQLVDQGFELAANIPTIQKTIPIAQSNALVQARTGYEILNVLGFVLPWLSLAFLAAGVLVAHRRARALIWAGASLTLAMLLLGAGVVVGRVAFVNAVSPEYVPGDAARVIYEAITPFIQATALSVGLVGFTVAVVAYLAGPFRGAIALRRIIKAWMTYLRGALSGVGVTTGPFGDWLFRARRFVRAGVAVIAGAVVVFVRPLTPAVIIWTAVLALVAILVIELLQRTPTERDQMEAAAEARSAALKAAAAEAAAANSQAANTAAPDHDSTDTDTAETASAPVLAGTDDTQASAAPPKPAPASKPADPE